MIQPSRVLDDLSGKQNPDADWTDSILASMPRQTSALQPDNALTGARNKPQAAGQ